MFNSKYKDEHDGTFKGNGFSYKNRIAIREKEIEQELVNDIKEGVKSILKLALMKCIEPKKEQVAVNNITINNYYYEKPNEKKKLTPLLMKVK